MIENMVVFEAIRSKKGGGTLCAVHKDLNPKLIEEYNEPFELLVIEVVAGDRDIRVITGYGPQENWEEEKRLPFFRALEEEVIKASNAGKSVIIEMDANSKLGRQFIPGDPHSITPNGKLLALVIERQNLIVANGTAKCEGVITRRRVTQNRVEESVIDIVIISKDMEERLDDIEIDEARKHVLTRIRRSKKGIKTKESDHNVIITTFNNKFTIDAREDKEEIYNLKNKDNQRKFKLYTSNTKMLSSVLDSKDNINILTNRLIKKINGCIAVNFKKIRVNSSNKGAEHKLYNKLSKMKEQGESESKMEEVKKEIAHLQEEKYKKVMEELAKTKDGDKLDPHKFWKIRKNYLSKEPRPTVGHVGH